MSKKYLKCRNVHDKEPLQQRRPHTCVMSDNKKRLSGLTGHLIHQSSSINEMM